MQNPMYEECEVDSIDETVMTENLPTNFKFKILQPYIEADFDSYEPHSIAIECLRTVKCRKKCVKEDADTVRNLVTYLHTYNMNVFNISSVYPYCEEFSELLQQYVLLECQILYKIPYYSKDRETEVQTRILRLLINIYTDYFKSKMIPSKEVMEKSAKAILHIFVELKLSYHKANYKILDNMTVILLKKIGRYEKINVLKGKHLSSDKDLDSIFSTNVIIGIDVEESTSSGYIEENPVKIKEDTGNLIEPAPNPKSKLVWNIWLLDDAVDPHVLPEEIQSKRDTKNKNSEDAKSRSESVIHKDKEKKDTIVSTIKSKSSVRSTTKANYYSDKLKQIDAILDSVTKEEADNNVSGSSLILTLKKLISEELKCENGTSTTTNNIEKNEETVIVDVNSITTNLEDTNEEEETLNLDIKINTEENNELVQTNNSEDLVVVDLMTSYRNNEEIIEAQITNEDFHLETETEENCDMYFTQIENTQQSYKGEDKIDTNIHINTEQMETKENNCFDGNSELDKSEIMPEEEEDTNIDIEIFVESEKAKDENAYINHVNENKILTSGEVNTIDEKVELEQIIASNKSSFISENKEQKEPDDTKISEIENSVEEILSSARNKQQEELDDTQKSLTETRNSTEKTELKHDEILILETSIENEKRNYTKEEGLFEKYKESEHDDILTRLDEEIRKIENAVVQEEAFDHNHFIMQPKVTVLEQNLSKNEELTLTSPLQKITKLNQNATSETADLSNGDQPLIQQIGDRLGENKFEEKSYWGSSDSPHLSSFKENSVVFSSLYDTVKSRKRQATKKPIEIIRSTPDIQSSYGKPKTYFDYKKLLGNSSNIGSGKHCLSSGSSSSYHSVDKLLSSYSSSRDERNYQKAPKKYMRPRPACEEFNDRRKIQKTEDFPHNQTGTSKCHTRKRSSSRDWRNSDRGTSKGPQRYSNFRITTPYSRPPPTGSGSSIRPPQIGSTTRASPTGSSSRSQTPSSHSNASSSRRWDLDKNGKYDFSADARHLLTTLSTIGGSMKYDTYVLFIKGSRRNIGMPHRGINCIPEISWIWWKELGEILVRKKFLIRRESGYGGIIPLIEVTDAGKEFLNDNDKELMEKPTDEMLSCLKTGRCVCSAKRLDDLMEDECSNTCDDLKENLKDDNNDTIILDAEEPVTKKSGIDFSNKVDELIEGLKEVDRNRGIEDESSNFLDDLLANTCDDLEKNLNDDSDDTIILDAEEPVTKKSRIDFSNKLDELIAGLNEVDRNRTDNEDESSNFSDDLLANTCDDLEKNLNDDRDDTIILDAEEPVTKKSRIDFSNKLDELIAGLNEVDRNRTDNEEESSNFSDDSLANTCDDLEENLKDDNNDTIILDAEEPVTKKSKIDFSNKLDELIAGLNEVDRNRTDNEDESSNFSDDLLANTCDDLEKNLNDDRDDTIILDAEEPVTKKSRIDFSNKLDELIAGLNEVDRNRTDNEEESSNFSDDLLANTCDDLEENLKDDNNDTIILDAEEPVTKKSKIDFSNKLDELIAGLNEVDRNRTDNEDESSNFSDDLLANTCDDLEKNLNDDRDDTIILDAEEPVTKKSRIDSSNKIDELIEGLKEVDRNRGIEDESSNFSDDLLANICDDLEKTLNDDSDDTIILDAEEPVTKKTRIDFSKLLETRLDNTDRIV